MDDEYALDPLHPHTIVIYHKVQSAFYIDWNQFEKIKLH